MQEILLSDEQQLFVKEAILGNNILVDACIGSGKTTAIQYLCNELPKEKSILYLTYNRLLKLDAKKKIHNENVLATNYHGFAYYMLQKNKLNSGKSDSIQIFLNNDIEIPKYDVLILDEYQDIDTEISKMLLKIKIANEKIQIIAVGDLDQKIYDKTTLDSSNFINEFLGEYKKLKFTNCFRLSKEYANKLGCIWGKTIIGVNNSCKIEKMCVNDVASFLAKQSCGDILCLGSRNGQLSNLLNNLELQYSEKFNKKTVYASIKDEDKSDKIKSDADCAIFTTYDSSKGLERKVCVIFDFTESYWNYRINKEDANYKILRNIFCVAMSRGKENIIFVTDEKEQMLFEDSLTGKSLIQFKKGIEDKPISGMFDYKFKEDVEECFKKLKITKIEVDDNTLIDIKRNDDLIDLSPCVGEYLEAVFFKGYDIDRQIEFSKEFNKNFNYVLKNEISLNSLGEKILYLTALETNQIRYCKQVNSQFVEEREKELLIDRLSTRLTPDNKCQVECTIDFATSEKLDQFFTAKGFCDVVVDNVVYELKFINELSHEHYLQCASYMIALNLSKGILWNVRDNSMYQIEIPDKKSFLDSVTKTITKRKVTEYYLPNKKSFAVIDTETNYHGDVMSIGLIVCDYFTFKIIDSSYYILEFESMEKGMFSDVLYLESIKNRTTKCFHDEAINEIKKIFKEHNVQCIVAYNTKFDKSKLPELDDYNWYDIMEIAAYKQFNKFIPNGADCCKTGKLKKGYKVQDILRLLTKNENYIEIHNAYYDALDEYKIMCLLGYPLETYISKKPCHQIINKYKSNLDSIDKKVVNSDGVIDLGNHLLIQRSNYDGDVPQFFECKSKLEVKNDDLNDVENIKNEAKNDNVISGSLNNDTLIKSNRNYCESDTNNDSKTEYINLRQASEMLQMNNNAVKNLINTNVIKGEKVNNRYKIERKSVEDYKEQQIKMMKNFDKILAIIFGCVGIGIIIGVIIAICMSVK